MTPYKRQLFICSAIEQCRETVNCCPHKQPHIKDERCIPRECRYAPGVEVVDCDPVDPEHPRAPVPQPVVTKTVEETLKAKIVEEAMKPEESEILLEHASKEQGIKEAVKKAAQRPVTVKKGPGKKKAGSS